LAAVAKGKRVLVGVTQRGRTHDGERGNHREERDRVALRVLRALRVETEFE
jgi:hypothetical protein